MSKLYANQWLRCLFGFNYAKWLETKAGSRGILRRRHVCKKSRGFTFESARTLLGPSSAVAQSLDHLDMTRHADTRIDLRRAIEQRPRFFAIAGRRAIN